MLEHGGHRKRILQRLKEGELREHEYLEILLFNAVPRRNTNDLAHRLLSEFGSVYEIFNADYERLTKVDGVGESIASYLFCIGRFFKAYESGASGLAACPIKTYDYAQFLAFIKTDYVGVEYERLDVYLLDAESRVIGKRSHSINHYGEVLVDPEFFLELFLTHSPSGIVLSHNHPLGTCAPSKVDDEATRQLLRLCKMHNVLFCEHFVYGLNGVYSYGESKRLARLAKKVEKEW